MVALTLLSLVLAGCASASAPSGLSPSPASSVPQSPQARAKADAAAILAAFIPPPGATRLSSAPGGVGGRLNGPEFTLGDPDVVGDGAWWHVPGMTPLQVLAWEQAHLPHQFTRGMVSGAAAPTPPTLPGGRTFPAMPYHYAAYGFGLPAVAGVLTLRQLNVQAAMTAAGQTYVRVDSQVAWQPVRPASTYLPSGSIASPWSPPCQG